MRLKKCIVCKKEKPLSEFYFSIRTIKKWTYKFYPSACKNCYTEYTKSYDKKWYKEIKKPDLNKHPWKKTLIHINKRCNYFSDSSYQYYGAKGIKCLITEKELKALWFRDKAYLMKRPSIDRINNDDNYTYDNCRYIEHKENCSKHKKCFGKDNGNYKGGLPKCIICGDPLKDYRSIKHKTCYLKQTQAKNSKITKDFLIKEYINKERTIKELSDLLNCSLGTVYKYMKKYGIRRQYRRK